MNLHLDYRKTRDKTTLIYILCSILSIIEYSILFQVKHRETYFWSGKKNYGILLKCLEYLYE